MKFIISTFLFNICILGVHSSNNRIVGGKDASDGEFPYQISFQHKAVHFCGGSLISESWIVTAAHCKVFTDPIEAVAGEHDFTSDSGDEQRRTVVEFTIHEDYDVKKKCCTPNDVAVVKVEEPFQLSSRVAVIGLPEPNTNPSGSGVVSGWGSVSRVPGEKYPDILQKATLPIHPQAQCFLYWASSPFADINICAGPLSGSASICSGDSGGPLVQDSDDERTLVGIVSWGAVPCGRLLKPGVFTQVSKYVDWIDDHTKFLIEQLLLVLLSEFFL